MHWINCDYYWAGCFQKVGIEGSLQCVVVVYLDYKTKLFFVSVSYVTCLAWYDQKKWFQSTSDSRVKRLHYLWWWFFHQLGPTALPFSYLCSINNRWPHATVHFLQSRGLLTNYKLSILCWKLHRSRCILWCSFDAGGSSRPQKNTLLGYVTADLTFCSIQEWLLVGPFLVGNNVLICVQSNPVYIYHTCRTEGMRKKVMVFYDKRWWGLSQRLSKSETLIQGNLYFVLKEHIIFCPSWLSAEPSKSATNQG